jgi:exopolyphosphatase/guanosine-5'-triphosphate,3'-diphosphate pyrophosphatase
MSEPLAAIDIGTNTVRLLIATPAGDGLRRLMDESETVRLGRGVDAGGRLAADRMAAAADAVAAFAARARAAGATVVLALATSAVRDAANRAEFVADVQRRSGLTVDIIDGEREAELTCRGALLGRPQAGRQAVIDIGGGSTEVILTQDGAVTAARSYQIGSGRLTERCLPSDPPTEAEIAAARATAAATLADVPSGEVAVAVLTAGTAEALRRLTPRADGDDRLTRAMLGAVLADLLARPAAATAARGVVDRERARVLPGGIVIVETLMDRLQVDTMVISQGGLREGALLERLDTAATERE